MVTILVVSIGCFDFCRGIWVVLVTVDLGCGGGGGGGSVAAKVIMLVTRSIESQSNTGKNFLPIRLCEPQTWL
jgi:hypothetical protein